MPEALEQRYQVYSRELGEGTLDRLLVLHSLMTSSLRVRGAQRTGGGWGQGRIGGVGQEGMVTVKGGQRGREWEEDREQREGEGQGEGWGRRRVAG